MEENKKQKEPIGFASRHPDHPEYQKYSVLIPSAMFLNMLGAVESLMHSMYLLKEENISNGTFKWYTEEDLEFVKDEKGETLLDKQGNPIKKIREDFWD
jgi:hypothetical protein